MVEDETIFGEYETKFVPVKVAFGRSDRRRVVAPALAPYEHPPRRGVERAIERGIETG
jgi:hypothetical protein